MIKVQVWGGHGRAAQCALTCLICMCENTLLYKGLLLVFHICGEKRCEIWSMFQKKTVGSFYLRAMQVWLLAMLWTLCSRLQSEANAPGEGGWEGWRKEHGRQLQHKEAAEFGTGPRPAGAAHQAEPQSSQECSSKLLPCCAGCAGILKEARLGMHESLFHILWSVQLARRSCHFFPGCVEPVWLVQCVLQWRSRGLSWKGLWQNCLLVLLIFGKGTDMELGARADCPGHLQKHLFFSECHHAVLQGYQPLTKHCSRWWSWSC